MLTIQNELIFVRSALGQGLSFLSDEKVLFAGYKLPHPLQYKILIRIQTTSQSSAMQVYNQAINDLDKELDHLKNTFEVELARHDASQQREF